MNDECRCPLCRPNPSRVTASEIRLEWARRAQPQPETASMTNERRTNTLTEVHAVVTARVAGSVLEYRGNHTTDRDSWDVMEEGNNFDFTSFMYRVVPKQAVWFGYKNSAGRIVRVSTSESLIDSGVRRFGGSKVIMKETNA
jgi:hypothetical protein